MSGRSGRAARGRRLAPWCDGATAARAGRAAWAALAALALLSVSPVRGDDDTQIDLQALVDAAPTGSVLQLAAGRYSAARLDRALTLRGGGAATVIDGKGSGTVLALHAPGIVVAALRVTGSGDDVSAKDSGIWVDRVAAGARIDDVAVEVDGFGIWVNAAQRPVVSGCRLTGRQDVARVSDLGNGIHLFHVTGGVVRGNTITGGRDGVYISNSTGCRIEGNDIRRTRFGVHYMYSHANQVVDNTTDSTSVGIALMYSKDILVTGNRVSRGHTHGLLLRTLYGSRIEGNEVRQSHDGLFFSGCSFDTLAANLVAGNDIGVLLSDSPDNAVTGNAFVDNELQLDYEDNRTIVWGAPVDGAGDGAGGIGNYWSDYLGWDRDGDGIGDKGHFPADIASYLVRRYPAVRLLMQSPAMVLLQSLESRFPVLRPPGVWDVQPLMKNPLAQEGPS